MGSAIHYKYENFIPCFSAAKQMRFRPLFKTHQVRFFDYNPSNNTSYGKYEKSNRHDKRSDKNQ